MRDLTTDDATVAPFQAREIQRQEIVEGRWRSQCYPATSQLVHLLIIILLRARVHVVAAVGVILADEPDVGAAVGLVCPADEVHLHLVDPVAAVELMDRAALRSVEDKPIEPAKPHQNAEEDRIVKLERQMEHLGRQIQYLARAINIQCPSK